MSNGLLTGSTAAFAGWDTSPIQDLSNNNNNAGYNANSKMKPYKEQQPIESNPFTSEPGQSAPTDDVYINPFIESVSSTQPAQPQSAHYVASSNQSRMAPIHQSKMSSPLAPLHENGNGNGNQMNEVFDLLFDTNDAAIGNSQQNDVQNATDAFYSFDFGVTDNEPQSANHSKNNSISTLSTVSNLRSDSSSSDSARDDYSSDDAADTLPTNGDSLVLSPPKKQARVPKKLRRGSNSQNGKSENERAFESLHKRFDPSLVGTVPVNQIHAKTQQQKQLKAAQKGKRHTEPTNIHSERLNQLKEEGLIREPHVARGSRQKSAKKLKKSEQKEQSKPNANNNPKKMNYNVLPEMHRGTALLKYGRRGYPHFRQFNLTDDNEHLRWFSTKKKLQKSSISVGDINEILTGQHTKEFRRIAWTTLTPASFSIIYDNKKKSLNLVAKSVDEMKMWVQALRKLRDMKKKGKNLKDLHTLEVEVDFRDRNRPQSRNHSGNFLRSHETKEREVDPVLQRKLIEDIGNLRKQFLEISREANNPIIQSTEEYSSIEQILSELEERVEELDHEVRNTRNTKIAENDVWRTRIDLESLRDKIKVITKQHKSAYKNSKASRRWSVF